MSTVDMIAHNIEVARWNDTLQEIVAPGTAIATNLMLPYPPSVNELFAHVPGLHGGQIRVKTKKYRQWAKDAGIMIMAQRRNIIEHPGRIYAQYYFTPPGTKHKRDLGNLEKAISDILVESRVIRDDSLIEQLDLHWDREWPDVGARVTIHNWPEAA